MSSTLDFSFSYFPHIMRCPFLEAIARNQKAHPGVGEGADLPPVVWAKVGSGLHVGFGCVAHHLRRDVEYVVWPVVER